MMNANSTFEVRILAHRVTCVAFLCMETLLHPKYISENWDTASRYSWLHKVGRQAIAVQLE